ncbi:MAG: sugar transferase [Oscillospiraceae bacterium]|nr:sugar transferase [Oscillospiraceae bacterium]
MYRKFGKRLFDIVFSIIGLVLLSPVLFVVAILVRIKLGAPALFRQERPGLSGKLFRLCKFRTMSDKKDENGKLLPDSKRLTSFGKMLRATSLDELPELWNILKGDMSLVGPRPLLVQYLPLYSAEQMRRHNVRPGLTGHAQISGRNAISWQEKFILDCWYVDNFSFHLDVKIIISTLIKVLDRSGISSETSETMEVFTGNEKY